MAKHAQEALGDRATILCQDLVELDLPEPVDAAFSNATFHWVHDHDRAVRARCIATIKPGGQLMAQCGGRGNIDSFRVLADEVAATDAVHARTSPTGSVPGTTPAPTRPNSGSSTPGSPTSRCWLEPRPVTPDDPRAFVQTVCLVRHLDPLPEELREPFIDRVLEQAGEPLVLEYVRLNMTARRPEIA